VPDYEVECGVHGTAQWNTSVEFQGVSERRVATTAVGTTPHPLSYCRATSAYLRLVVFPVAAPVSRHESGRGGFFSIPPTSRGN
jgi:hypothetical protein